MINITTSIKISEDEITETFIRSSGKGGQRVNKVETAVQIRFNALHCETIRPEVFARLRSIAGSRMTAEGVIIITAEKYRSQLRNREEALERLSDLIRKATVVQRARRATKPSRNAKNRRMDSKKKRGNVKKLRSSKNYD
jgi:ribosome-associated protein